MRSGRDANNDAIQLHCFALVTGRVIANYGVCELVDMQANAAPE